MSIRLFEMEIPEELYGKIVNAIEGKKRTDIFYLEIQKEIIKRLEDSFSQVNTDTNKTIDKDFISVTRESVGEAEQVTILIPLKGRN